MFNWFNRRHKIRREDDVKEQMKKAIDEKHKACLESLEKLKQYTLERRLHDEPYMGPDRRIVKA